MFFGLKHEAEVGHVFEVEHVIGVEHKAKVG